MDITVKSRDAEQLARAVRQHASHSAIEREISRELRSVARRVEGRMINVIPSALPRRGGLASEMQSSTSANVDDIDGGVSLRFENRSYDVRTLIGERLHHPVFGNRSVWVEQTRGLNPRAFPAEFEKQTRDFERAVVRATEEIARKVTDI